MLDERLNPVGLRDYLSQQHWARYEFACRHLKAGMRVLDIACGAGYGAAMMRDAGCEVTGGDYDGDILEEAKVNWPGIRFIKADAMALPFEDAYFDAVVSFETIEHVVDGDRFLAEMKRVLKPGGIFICSTPNIRYTSHPPYHVKEYTPAEYFSLMKNHFPQVELAGQYFRFTDRVRDLMKWKVVPKVAALVRMVGLKLLLKAILNKVTRPANSSVSPSQAVPVHQNQVFRRNQKYDVVPLKQDAYGLLRIMVTKAIKQ